MRGLVWVLPAVAFLMVCVCGSPEQSLAGPAPPVSDKPAAKSAAVPDTITLDTSQGAVTLPHLAHAKRLHCAMCHSEIKPGQIAWDKRTVHAYCRDCHRTQGGGPTTCKGCHKQ